ncbi:unnamed protein product [Parascedosporium putredinis]|uniref:Cyanovirin-N domain-containing protein n=1 Tax=Parascedosporium putredinis TaxID=1442378 RepID=A0A9P1H7H5_9PEZI|nr:unnamed protein product [Parascedosporium putredinis]CAI7998440.1 unnamed protein product [Parascedosporium putredinis]
MKLLAVIVGGVALFSEVASCQGFFASCKSNWYVERGTSIMYAECSNEDGDFVESRLDLNKCIANDNGALSGRERGNFYNACRSCLPDTLLPVAGEDVGSGGLVPSLPPQTSILTCACSQKDATEVLNSDVDLDAFIGSDADGILNCFGQSGEEVDE